jgi:hypothetical protein
MRAVVIFAIGVGCSRGEPVDTARAREPVPVPGHGSEDIVPADVADLARCNDAPRVTLEQLAAGEHAGERVAVDLVPEPILDCTLMACRYGDERDRLMAGRKDQCCNQCGGGYGVVMRRDQALWLLDVGRCDGMDCNYHCEPFGWKPTHRYRFVGVTGSTSRLELHVERYCAVDP